MEKKNLTQIPVPKSIVETSEAFVKIMKEHTDDKIVTLFEELTKEVKDNIFKGASTFCPLCFFIFRDYKTPMWKAGCYPMIPTSMDGTQEITMEMHSFALRKVIKEMKAAEYKDFKLVGVITIRDSHLRKYDKKELLDELGNIKPGFVRPKEDPQAVDALTFELEEIFVKHTKAYEYIQSSDGNFVFRPEPLIDDKRPYNEIEDKHSNFGFLFTEGVKMN